MIDSSMGKRALSVQQLNGASLPFYLFAIASCICRKVTSKHLATRY